MNDITILKEATAQYLAKTDLDTPAILEQEGVPVAVLLSIDTYQELLQAKETISAREAKRLANRAIFQELVGCALSVEEPVFFPKPYAHWRVPYRTFDGELIKLVAVNAHTGEVQLTETERNELLASATEWVSKNSAKT